MCMSKKAFEVLATTVKWESSIGPMTVREMTCEHLRKAAECVQYNWRFDSNETLSRDEWCWLFYNELHRREMIDGRVAEARSKVKELREALSKAEKELEKAKFCC